jgi:hypothetical protein
MSSDLGVPFPFAEMLSKSDVITVTVIHLVITSIEHFIAISGFEPGIAIVGANVTSVYASMCFIQRHKPPKQWSICW